MFDSDRQCCSGQFYRRDLTLHECPGCKCRPPVYAILWNGFNGDDMDRFLTHHGDGTHFLDRGILMTNPGRLSVQLGIWLVREGDSLERVHPLKFYTEFEPADG